MLFLKYMLLVVGIGMFVVAAAIVANDAWMIVQYRRKTALGAVAIEPQPLRWRASVALAFLAWAPLLIALSIAVIPSGMAGVRVSQTSGTVAGTLYPGVPLVTPLVEHVRCSIARDQLFTTGDLEDGKIVLVNDSSRPNRLKFRQRRTNPRTGHYRSVSTRSQASGLHPEPSAATDRKEIGAADRG